MTQLQGDWYLVDCTWDSGHMSGRTMDVNLQTEPEGFPLLTLAVMGNYEDW